VFTPSNADGGRDRPAAQPCDVAVGPVHLPVRRSSATAPRKARCGWFAPRVLRVLRRIAAAARPAGGGQGLGGRRRWRAAPEGGDDRAAALRPGKSPRTCGRVGLRPRRDSRLCPPAGLPWRALHGAGPARLL